MTQFQILAHGLTAQVQIAIFHADIVATISIVLNGERRRDALAEHRQTAHQNLNVASRHLGILRLSLTHYAHSLHAVLTAQLVGLVAKACILRLIEY